MIMVSKVERSTDDQRELARTRWMRAGRWMGQGLLLGVLTWNTAKPDGTQAAAKAEAEIQVSHEASADGLAAAGAAIRTNTAQISALKKLVDTSTEKARATCEARNRETQAYLKGLERALRLPHKRVARAAARARADDHKLAGAKISQEWAKHDQTVSQRLYKEAKLRRGRIKLKAPPRKLKQLIRQKARKGDLPAVLTE
jgi:hypothetical protein